MKFLEKYERIPEWIRWILFIPISICASFAIAFVLQISMFTMLGKTIMYSIISYCTQHVTSLVCFYTFIPKGKKTVVKFYLIADIVILFLLVVMASYWYFHSSIKGKPFIFNIEALQTFIIMLLNTIIAFTFYEYVKPDSRVVLKVKSLVNLKIIQSLGYPLFFIGVIVWVFIANYELINSIRNFIAKFF